jgi:hypothetical protein
MPICSWIRAGALVPERLQGVRACWIAHLELDVNATFPLEESFGRTLVALFQKYGLDDLSGEWRYIIARKE